ncbi:protein of unknown function [Pararobbsia alpina]
MVSRVSQPLHMRAGIASPGRQFPVASRTLKRGDAAGTGRNNCNS